MVSRSLEDCRLGVPFRFPVVAEIILDVDLVLTLSALLLLLLPPLS